jgi:hypothetical protein
MRRLHHHLIARRTFQLKVPRVQTHALKALRVQHVPARQEAHGVLAVRVALHVADRTERVMQTAPAHVRRPCG